MQLSSVCDPGQTRTSGRYQTLPETGPATVSVYCCGLDKPIFDITCYWSRFVCYFYDFELEIKMCNYKILIISFVLSLCLSFIHAGIVTITTKK